MSDGKRQTPETVGAGRGVDEICAFHEPEPDAAVSDDAARERRVAVLRPYRWRPGQSGNPGGRLGGLARRARDATNDGADLIDFLLGVMRDPTARTRDRLAAASELLARAYGRAPQFVAIEKWEQHRHQQPWFEGLKKMPVEDVRTLLRLLKQAWGESAPPALEPKE
jgi:hypothetical protein